MGTTSSTGRKDISPETLEISSRLEKIDLFRNEKASSLLKVAQCLEMQRFNKGQILLEQGEPADSLYIISTGTVSFSTKTVGPNGDEDKFLGELGPGFTFGEFGLVYNVRRTARAVACSDEVVVLVLKKDIYDKISTSKYLRPLKERVQSVCAMLMQDGLRQLPFLQGLDENTLHQIGQLFQFEVVPENVKVCREGEFGDRFYILFHGEVVVTMKDDMDFDCEITRLRDGAKFGDTSLLSNEPRTATITTLTPCEIFSLERKDLQTFIQAAPTLGEDMLERMLSFSNANLIKNSVPIFKSLSIQSQQLLGVVSSLRTFSPGTIILEEGREEHSDIYVIIRGTVNVYNGTKKVRSISKGYFGEVALFSDQPSTATVKVANHALTCLIIPQRSFRNIMVREPSMYAEVAIRVFGKQVKLKYLLRHPKGRENFLKYCEKEFAQENVDFWLEVSELEDLEQRKIMKQVLKALQVDIDAVIARKRKMLISKANRIFSLYIKPGAEMEINIAAPVRTKIITLMDNNEYSYNMFAEAKREIFKLVEADNFTRYRESDQFKEFLESMGVYDNLLIEEHHE